MAIEKIEPVSIIGFYSELDSILKKCCESGCFQIESAFSSQSSEKGLSMINEKNPYTAPLKKLSSIATELGIDLKETDFSGCILEDVSEFTDLCDTIELQLSETSKRRQNALQIISERKGAIIQITHLKGLHEEFDKIFNCKHIHVRVGKLSFESKQKLSFYEQNFFFVPFESDNNFCWGMYFCPIELKDVVDNIFNSMYFEPIRIPDYVTGNTSEAFERLNEQIKENMDVVDKANQELKKYADEYEARIQQAFSKLNYKKSIFDLHKKVGVIKDKVYVRGFVPLKDKENFEKLFEDSKTVSLSFTLPDEDAGCVLPTMLKNSWFSKPYKMLVEMYGIPNYNGLNPTAFVALTYTLMFGIMFGDLGQGFIIWLLGLIIGKKVHKQFGGMMTRCGFSSMLFGTIYGSVFGFEELLNPVFEKMGIGFLPLHPFKNTNFILGTAVGIGIVLIMISMIINIIIGFKEHDIEKAVFSNNGIAGLVFYFSIVAGIVSTMMFNVKIMSMPFVILCIVVPLLCIFCRVPLSVAIKYKKFRLSNEEEDMTIGNFIVENFFEMFEYLLSYVSNTMSFLRVGGFVLSHAGMMLVVSTLMGMCGNFGQPFVLVLGNLFVMLMEGMIVSIQIIRLEFYEIFSRFYNGNGRPFEPVEIKFSSQID